MKKKLIVNLAGVSLISATFAACAWGSEPTPDLGQLRNLSQDAAGRIQSGVIVYSRQKTTHVIPDVPERVLRVDANFGRRSVANASLHERVTLSFDLPGKKWRLDVVDLRNVEEVARQHGLSIESTSTSVSQLVGEKGYVMRFRETARRPYLSILRLPEQARWEPPIATGVVPVEMLDESDGKRVRLEPSDGKLKLTVQGPGGESIYELDPALDYCWKSLQIKRGDVTVTRKVCSDYQVVDGILYPHHYEVTEFNADGTVRFQETVTVQSALLNRDVNESTFEIDVPIGTLVSGQGSEYISARAGRLHYDEASQVTTKLRETWAELNP